MLAAGAHAALRRGRALVRPLVDAEEHVLELDHAGVDEQQRRVVARHQRRRGHDGVATVGEVLQELAANLVGGHARNHSGEPGRRRRARPFGKAVDFTREAGGAPNRDARRAQLSSSTRAPAARSTLNAMPGRSRATAGSAAGAPSRGRRRGARRSGAARGRSPARARRRGRWRPARRARPRRRRPSPSACGRWRGARSRRPSAGRRPARSGRRTGSRRRRVRRAAGRLSAAVAPVASSRARSSARGYSRRARWAMARCFSVRGAAPTRGRGRVGAYSSIGAGGSPLARSAPGAGTPTAARILASISRAISECSRRNSRVLSLPWPIFSPL